MGTRFRMQAKRKGVRMVREQTGTKEGYLIHQLRQFLHEKQIELPPEVQNAWDQVDVSRDKLGLLEAEYDEVEEKYHGQEIRYTTDEAKFVDNLLKADSAPTLLVDRDRKAFSLTDEVMGERYSRSPFKLAESRAQINDWLLKVTKESNFQQFQLRVTHGLDEMDEATKETWWKEVERTWNLDSSATTLLNTGDSTFSQGIGSEPLSAADLVKVGPGSLDLKDPVPRKLLPEEPILDAPEKPSFAPTIESDDLWEPGEIPPPTQHEQKSDDSTQSVSTGLSHTHRTISTDEVASNTTIEQACSCLNGPICQDHSIHSENRTRPSTFIERQISLLASQQRRSPLSTPMQEISDSEAPTKISPPIPRTDSPKPTTATSEPLIPDWTTDLVDDYKLSERDPVSTNDEPTPRLRPHETSAFPCPSFDTSRSSTVEHVSPEASIATPPVWMSQPKASSESFLPVLWLNPGAFARVSDSTDIWNLPFVGISDSTLRLPGPISDDMYL